MTLASELESALEEAAAGGSQVVVDLSGTTLLDSRAIGILLAWSERLGAAGGGLALVAATPEVRRLFAVIGLDREFRFCADRDEALTG
jgi:anti-anti-sigma factor